MIYFLSPFSFYLLTCSICFNFPSTFYFQFLSVFLFFIFYFPPSFSFCFFSSFFVLLFFSVFFLLFFPLLFSLYLSFTFFQLILKNLFLPPRTRKWLIKKFFCRCDLVEVLWLMVCCYTLLVNITGNPTEVRCIYILDLYLYIFTYTKRIWYMLYIYCL